MMHPNQQPRLRVDRATEYIANQITPMQAAQVVAAHVVNLLPYDVEEIMRPLELFGEEVLTELLDPESLKVDPLKAHSERWTPRLKPRWLTLCGALSIRQPSMDPRTLALQMIGICGVSKAVERIPEILTDPLPPEPSEEPPMSEPGNDDTSEESLPRDEPVLPAAEGLPVPDSTGEDAGSDQRVPPLDA